MTHRTRLAVAAAVALSPVVASAQSLDGKGRGLDGLDESVVMASLSANGLDGLLDRDFEVYKVPAAEREQQRAGIALQQLAGAGGLKPADRRAVAERVARALDGSIDKANNAAQLLQTAFTLTAAGIDPTVTELEVFGENPAAQAQLKPVVETTRRMFQKAQTLAAAQFAAVQGKVSNSNFKQMQKELKAVGTVRRNAAFSFAHAGYAMCLSLPKDDPARKRFADESIENLKKFDGPRFGMESALRVQFGKLQLVKGDYATAKTTLDAAAQVEGAPKPPPSSGDQNQARYFAAVADLLAGNLNAVAADASAVEQWQAGNYLPTLPSGAQSQVKAADAMLRFRLASAQADAANDPGEKQKANDQAVTILSDLLQSNDDPALHDLVFDQLATRIPEHPDLAKLNPLALQALLQQGLDEYYKKEGEPVDLPKLRRGVDAATELARREGQPGVSHETAVNAAYFAPYALDRKAHDDLAAATAYVDFMQRYHDEPDKSQDAMQHAGSLVEKLHAAAKAGASDPAVNALYDRFLPLAIAPPYNQKQVAFEYAGVLREQGKYLDAVKYYDLVPPADKQHEGAQFFTLVSLYSALSDPQFKLPAEQRQPTAERLESLAGQVSTASEAAAAAAASAEDKQRALSRVAIARFDAATVARRDLKDPAKTLAVLDGFEARVAGLGNAAEFGQSVLILRVNARMDAGQSAEATDELVKLLATNPEQGETLLFQLVQQIARDLDTAKANHDVAAERQLAANQAKLSGFMVTYAQDNKDQKVRAQLPAYRLFDADSKRQAAELIEDPAGRTAELASALKQYQTLAAAGDHSPNVQLGEGLTQFDLGHYPETIAALAPVMKQVGQPFVDQNGQQVANPQFWEAYYKQMRAVAEVAKAKPADATAQANVKAVKQKLGGFYVLYGDRTGGPGYHDEFAHLAADLKVPVKVTVPVPPK